MDGYPSSSFKKGFVLKNDLTRKIHHAYLLPFWPNILRLASVYPRDMSIPKTVSKYQEVLLKEYECPCSKSPR